jgi:hypothetical protein
VTPLAHGGGVPETLSVLVPLALVIVLLRMGAKKTPPEDPPADGTAPGGPEEPGEPV